MNPIRPSCPIGWHDLPQAGLARRRLCLGLAATFAAVWPVATLQAASEEAASRPAGGPGGARRLGLVIGNAAYGEVPLRSAVGDARLMADTLGHLGVSVETVLDAGRAGMLEAVNTFLDRAGPAELRVIYYAGHGAQYRGRTFLVPVDAHLRSEDDLPAQGVDTHDLLDRIARFDSGVNLVFVDACRAPPVARNEAGRSRSVSTAKGGLAPLVAPKGTVVVYATAPDQLALDHGSDEHSPFTRHLAQELVHANQPIEQVLKRVRQGVMRDTGNRQVPWDSSSLVGDFCLGTAGSTDCHASADPGRSVDLRRL